MITLPGNGVATPMETISSCRLFPKYIRVRLKSMSTVLVCSFPGLNLVYVVSFYHSSNVTFVSEPRNISSSRLDASSPSGDANPPIRLSYHGAVHYNSGLF